jgi:DUF1707 SHOCT-like domain
MDDRIRISDADRDRVIGRLNHHFAEGRLTQEELDDRVTKVLHAKTFGDLRGVMADLPEPVSVPAGAPHLPHGAPPRAFRRRRPRVLPLVALALLAVLILPVGGLLLFIVKALVVMWLLACLAGIFVVSQIRRHLRSGWRSGYMRYWYSDRGWGGPDASKFTGMPGTFGPRSGGCGRRGRRYTI